MRNNFRYTISHIHNDAVSGTYARIVANGYTLQAVEKDYIKEIHIWKAAKLPLPRAILQCNNETIDFNYKLEA
jgi:hypothetical protein